MGDDNSGQGTIGVGGNVTGSTFNINQAAPVSQEAPDSSLFLLPPNPSNFVGREEEEAALVAALASGGGTQAIVGVQGMGGVGKTVLAGRVARKLEDTFPDARFAIDLRGVSDNPMTPQQVMSNVLLRFETAQRLPDDPDALKQQYDALLASKRVLLLIDNARDAAQVADLLPQAPSAAIITSRATLTLPGVEITPLDTLSRADAITLLRKLLPDGITAEDLDALAACCCDHPLALTVAGTALNTHWHDYETTAEYIAEIEADREGLKLAEQEDYDLMACLSRSLTLLQQDEPALVERWRDLTAFVGDFGADGAAAVMAVEDPRPILRRLRQTGFLEAGEERGTYTFHDLMRDLARRGQAIDRFHEAEYRHGVWIKDRLTEAKEMYKSGGDGVLEGLAWWDDQIAEITAARTRIAAHLRADADDQGLALSMADAGVYLTDLRLHSRDRIIWWQDALASARKTGHRAGEGAALGNLGLAWANLGETRKAIDFYEKRIVIAREIGDRRGEGNALGCLGNAWSNLGETRKAIDFYEQQLEITREIGDRRGEGIALHNMAEELPRIGETARAIATARAALVICEEIEDPTIDQTRQLLARLEG